MTIYDQSCVLQTSGNSPLGAPALRGVKLRLFRHITPCGDTMQCKQRRWVCTVQAVAGPEGQLLNVPRLYGSCCEWIRFAGDIIHLRYWRLRSLNLKMALRKGDSLFIFGSMLLCTWEIILNDPVKRILLATLPFWINVASACSLYSDKSWYMIVFHWMGVSKKDEQNEVLHISPYLSYYHALQVRSLKLMSCCPDPLHVLGAQRISQPVCSC